MDRTWRLCDDNLWYECEGIQVKGQNKTYRSTISPNGNELPFCGGSEHFGVYNSSDNDPIHLLVKVTDDQFIKLFYTNSQLTNYFIEWLYRQVTHSEKGEYYLKTHHQ